jgi:hypothetical protein
MNASERLRAACKQRARQVATRETLQSSHSLTLIPLVRFSRLVRPQQTVARVPQATLHVG